MKDGDNLADHLTSDVTSDESDSDADSRAVLANVSDAVSATVSEVEENGTQAQPPEDSEDDRSCFRAPFSSFDHHGPRAKPDWWTDAWDHLQCVKLSVIGNVEPFFPLGFRDETHMDVCASDQPGFQTQTDSTTGETILPGEGNELLAGVIGAIWSDHHGTITRCANKNTPTPEMIHLRNFAMLLSLCPECGTLNFQTHSTKLVEEYDVIVPWKERGYEGTEMDEIHVEWRKVIQGSREVIRAW
jgi:hypothetical protein